MIVISNHVKQIGMSVPPGAVVRVNLAWVKTKEEVQKIVDDFPHQTIWLDYPTGRRKPPQPKMSLLEAIALCHLSPRIGYFAFSNAEDRNLIELIRTVVPPAVRLVPKIETLDGVDRLATIVEAARTDVLMLDKEDLYVDCDATVGLFDLKVEYVRAWCGSAGVKCLELKGVVFA